MLNEESLIDDELRIKIPTRAKIITLIWLLICVISFFFWLNFFYDIVSLLQKCYSAIGMNFTQPLVTQHASKIYTNSAFKFS